MLTYVYNRLVHCSINTCTFDLELNRRIADFSLQFKVSNGKRSTDAEQHAGFLAKLQTTLERGCATF